MNLVELGSAPSKYSWTVCPESVHGRGCGGERCLPVDFESLLGYLQVVNRYIVRPCWGFVDFGRYVFRRLVLYARICNFGYPDTTDAFPHFVGVRAQQKNR